MTPKHLVDDILMRGCADWVDACEVASVALTEGKAKSPDAMRELALELIRNVVRQGLMELGDVTRGGFGKWDLPIEEGLARVEREWLALGRNPTLAEICWLQNTSRGNELGEELLKKRSGGSQ